MRASPAIASPILSQSRLIAKVYPNGEFTVGYDATRRMKKHPEPKEIPQREYWRKRLLGTPDTRRALAISRAMDIGLSIPANSPKTRRGSNGITSYGQRLVRNAAFLLEKKYTIKKLTFATLTLPGMSQEDMDSVCLDWSNIVKEVFKEIGRAYERNTQTKFTYVSVTEIQEKRYERSGEIGLHLHFVYVGKRKVADKWALSPSEIRGIWKRVVSRRCSGEYDFNASENLQRVKKSAASYLGKYLTKGVMATRRIIAEGRSHLLPTAWYSIARRLSSAVRRGVHRSPQLAKAIVRNLSKAEISKVIAYQGTITVDTKLCGPRIFGYYGRLTDEVIGKKDDDIIRLLDTLR